MARVTSFVPLLLLVVTGLASGEEHQNEELAIESLKSDHRHLMVRPVDSPSDQLQVSIGLHLLDADVCERTEKATLGGWVHLEWDDHRLGWSGNSVKQTRVWPEEIWNPDIVPYNRVPVTSNWLQQMPAVVYPSGKVIYVPEVSVTVHCHRTQTDDHDRITCPLKFGSWTHNVGEMDLVLKNDTIDTSEFIHNGHWTVESSHLVRKEKIYTCCPEPYVSIEGEVVLKPQRT